MQNSVYLNSPDNPNRPRERIAFWLSELRLGVRNFRQAPRAFKKDWRGYVKDCIEMIRKYRLMLGEGGDF